MSIFSGLDGIVKTDYQLAPLTWYGLGGYADYFITPQTVEELKKVVQRCRENSIPMYVLGFGSNLLVNDDGIRGAVIKLSGDELTASKFDGEWLTVWGGADFEGKSKKYFGNYARHFQELPNFLAGEKHERTA